MSDAVLLNVFAQSQLTNCKKVTLTADNLNPVFILYI